MGGAGILFLIGSFTTYVAVDVPVSEITELGVDLLRPVQDDRQIHTTNLKLFLREKRFESLPLSLKLGGIAMRSTGSITQLTGTWEGGDLRTETLDSPGYGIGPAIEASLAIWQGSSGWQPRVSVDLLGGVLLHDRRFPAGGDYYNGTFQAGLSLDLQPTTKDIVGLGYRVTHTSNGQGLSANNPGYNAAGWSLRWQHRF